jgi:hypothetical protein
LRRFLRFLPWTFGLLVLAIAAFVIWGYTPAQPLPESLGALHSDSRVIVETNHWITFQPTGSHPATGFIFYPGARVDPRAYAPAAHAIAEQGYLVVIVPMPLNLAVFSPGAAAEVIAAYPGIQTWAVGGHSLGGAMAANFVYTHPDSVQGLILWASYPASNNDLSQYHIRVASISATLDGLSTPEKIAASKLILPADTVWVVIDGGDHAGFGWYGPQSGDNPATITREEQQAQIVAATLALLGAISK